jgi:hypothetical protein
MVTTSVGLRLFAIFRLPLADLDTHYEFQPVMKREQTRQTIGETAPWLANFARGRCGFIGFNFAASTAERRRLARN